MKNYLLSISYHNEQVTESTYRQLVETMQIDPCEVYVLDNNCPLVRDKNFLKNLCDKYEFKYFNAGTNLGLAGGWNFLINQLPDDCDRMILFDGDGYPVTLNWHIPLLKVHDDPRVVWSTLSHKTSTREMMERGFTPEIISGYKCKITKTPVVNTICAFKRSWLKEINGLKEPNRYYGGVEMYLWSKKKDNLWVFIEDYEEIQHPIEADRVYTVYKWYHAHEGLDISLEEFIEKGDPREKFPTTYRSLQIVEEISKKIASFHHHHYVLLDALNTFKKEKIMYVEIGTYAGSSSALSLYNPNVSTIAIDAGENVSLDKVTKDVLDLHPGRDFTYIQGNSHSSATLANLKYQLELRGANIDVLFIDGGHSYSDVIKDFEMYSPLVNIGGYIVFDDYSDYKYSPDVKPAVDKIVKGNKNYQIIGCVENVLHAKTAYPMDKNNCFIIKKLK